MPGSASDILNSTSSLRRDSAKRTQVRNHRKLQGLCRGPPRVTVTPTYLDIGGAPTFDREQWLDGAYDFGRSRFQDDSNDPRSEQHRLKCLYSTCVDRRVDGLERPVDIEYFGVLHARAALRPEPQQALMAFQRTCTS